MSYGMFGIGIDVIGLAKGFAPELRSIAVGTDGTHHPIWWASPKELAALLGHLLGRCFHRRLSLGGRLFRRLCGHKKKRV